MAASPCLGPWRWSAGKDREENEEAQLDKFKEKEVQERKATCGGEARGWTFVMKDNENVMKENVMREVCDHQKEKAKASDGMQKVLLYEFLASKPLDRLAAARPQLDLASNARGCDDSENPLTKCLA